MKTTPTFPVPVLLLLVLSLGQFPAAMSSDFGEATVPKTGVYIITMTSDPSGSSRTNLILQINSRDTTFTAYGEQNVIAGLSVALPLKARDRVGGRISGSSRDNGFKLGVAFASYSTEFFKTMGSAGFILTQDVGFCKYFSAGSWQNWNVNVFAFSAPKDGVFWVMARPNPPSGQPSTFTIGDDLFKVYSKYGVPTSASGAFYLTWRNHLNMRMDQGPTTMEGATILSWVWLEGNAVKELNGTNIAFTALVDTTKTYGLDEKVSFNGRTPLDRGNMYSAPRRVISISVSGSYIMSLRGHANSGGSSSLKLELYHNDRVTLAFYAQRGVSSGQAGVFNFVRGDKLYVRAAGSRDPGTNTMISIALLYKES